MLTPGDPGDDFSLCDDRSARVTVAQLVVGNRLIPDHLTGPRVERDEVRVVGGGDDLVAVDRERPHPADEDVVGIDLELLLVFPEQIAGQPVDRLNQPVRLRNVQNPLIHQRGRHLIAWPERPRPHELQLVGVRPVDLLERAVAPRVERAPPVDPVHRIRVGEHRVGDRRELREPGRRTRFVTRGGAGRSRPGRPASRRTPR